MSQPGLPGSQFPGEDAMIRRLKDLERQVQQFTAANVLATAGIGVIPDGVVVDGQMQFKREDGTLGVSVDPVTGTFMAYSADGSAPVARFGALVETAPGSYGVEVLVGSTWVRLGNQTTTWDAVSGKPSTFPPSGHTHGGGDITSAVANATNAASATLAQEAEGSQYGWTNNVAGTEFYALWVGNNAGYKFGRNVSSVRYKQNIRSHRTDPAKVLNLTPVLYDRIPNPPQTAPTNEYGLIAEQVAQYCPELVTWFNGQIDSVRYDLLPVALLNVVKHQDTQIKALESAVKTLVPSFTLPGPAPVAPNVPSSMAPSPQPSPLPYTIEPQ